MKKRSFFNLQSIAIFVAFLAHSVATFIYFTTGENFKILQYPSLNLEFFKLIIAEAKAMTSQASLIMLFLYFGISANDENKAKRLLLIAVLIETILGCPISSTPYALINTLRYPLWVGAGVFIIIWANGKAKSRVFPIIGTSIMTFCHILGSMEPLELLNFFRSLPFILAFGVMIVRFATLAVSDKKKVPSAENTNVWHCDCGHDMTSNYCIYCGKKRP